MDTTRFLEYLHGNEATEALADALTELVLARRATAARRSTDLTRAPEQLRIAG